MSSNGTTFWMAVLQLVCVLSFADLSMAGMSLCQDIIARHEDRLTHPADRVPGYEKLLDG
jgi:hypothetical protein